MWDRLNLGQEGGKRWWEKNNKKRRQQVGHDRATQRHVNCKREKKGGDKVERAPLVKKEAPHSGLFCLSNVYGVKTGGQECFLMTRVLAKRFGRGFLVCKAKRTNESTMATNSGKRELCERQNGRKCVTKGGSWTSTSSWGEKRKAGGEHLNALGRARVRRKPKKEKQKRKKTKEQLLAQTSEQ